MEVVNVSGTAAPYNVNYYSLNLATLSPAPIAQVLNRSATAYSNQRKVDRTSNGVLWSMYWTGSDGFFGSIVWAFRYSTDDGQTWPGPTMGFSSAGTGSSYTPNASFFIDADDYAHVAYKDNFDGYLYYRRGTPNGDRTAWSWSSPYQLHNATNVDYPDLVAHPEGSDLIIDINKNGSTLFTTQANRPVISSDTEATEEAVPDITGVTSGEYVTVDIDQVGSTVPGSDLTVFVRYARAVS